MYGGIYLWYSWPMESSHIRRFLSVSGVLASSPFLLGITRNLTVSIGTSFTLGQMVQRVVDFLAASITTVASAMFLVGAFMIVLAGAKEDYKQQGKDLMMGSIMSIGVVLGAYAIYRTVALFLQ